MKFHLLIISVFLMFAAFSATVLMADIADGLVGHWLLDGNAADSSGNGNDGTPSGDPVWVDTQPGFGQGLSFDGQDDRIVLEAGASLAGPTDFSLSLWVKTDSGGAHTLVQQRNGGISGEYILNVGTSHNVAMNPGQVYFMVFNGNMQWEIWSSKTINDGVWHHLAAVREGQTGTIYIDGEPDGTAANNVLDLDGALKVAIGADIRNNTRYFKGEMDEVSIYNRALEPEDIQTLANSEKILVEPVGTLTATWGAVKH